MRPNGPIGSECHHTKPVHAPKPGDKTKVGDLRLICSNCHRMIHAKRLWLTMEELAAIVGRAAEVSRRAKEHT
jgi:5-methylcytosine-specific restriction protein A